MTDPTLYCVFDKCNTRRERDYWCNKHWGMFRHDCVEPGCDSKVLYDDEPRCFRHSPDKGSSVRGYSAYMMSQEAKLLAPSIPLEISF